VKRENLRKKGRQDGENGIGTCGDGAHDEEEEGSGLWMLPRGWVGEEATGLDWRPLIRLLLLPLPLNGRRKENVLEEANDEMASTLSGGFFHQLVKRKWRKYFLKWQEGKKGSLRVALDLIFSRVFINFD
jgi:hypothetical protein